MAENESRVDLDLGNGHTLRFYGWGPDRTLNPQYIGTEDEQRSGAIVSHAKPDGSYCEGAVTFDTPAMRKLAPGRPKWTVESSEPLTLTRSLRCSCGDHGFIRDGRWVRA